MHGQIVEEYVLRNEETKGELIEGRVARQVAINAEFRDYFRLREKELYEYVRNEVTEGSEAIMTQC